jgi:hypothetical protein
MRHNAYLARGEVCFKKMQCPTNSFPIWGGGGGGGMEVQMMTIMERLAAIGAYTLQSFGGSTGEQVSGGVRTETWGHEKSCKSIRFMFSN